MPRHKPYTVKIELTRGCTRRCTFCALPEMEWVNDKFVFMDEQTFRRTIFGASVWDKFRIEFAERGEPSFHPRLHEYFAMARAALPHAQLMMTSNGDTVRKYKDKYPDFVERMFDAGLNFLMLDCYDRERFEMMRKMFPKAKLFFGEDGDGDTHPYRYVGTAHRTMILVDAAPRPTSIIRRYHNQGGSVNVERARAEGHTVFDVTEPLQSMCTRPFRELVVHVEGNVVLCCNDWKQEHIVGNVNSEPLSALWDKLDTARARLLKKDRAGVTPCNKCSERAGFRVGLEMDWFGPPKAPKSAKTAAPVK
jgi:radical SAM protein with 4Fe4S-binding SPASM domain